MSTVTVIGVITPLVWLGWLVLTDWVPMYPLNDLEHRDRHQRAVGAMTTYPAGLLVSAGVLIGQSWSLATAVIIAGSVVVGHLAGWWLPYAGVSVGPQREVYREEYSRTVSVLPKAGHDVVVDVQHMVTGVLGLVMLGTSLLSFAHLTLRVM
ncbi:MAG TPA: hypothetical protein VIE19_10340 [Lapillicoccus sp.]|jgi:hypothetical protein